MRTQDFHAPQESSGNGNAPTRLGPYELLDVVGRGGGGVVYRARGPRGDVAIKTLRRASEHGLASLRAEIHALRRVRHPGVVRVSEDGIHEGTPWFAMEWLEGETLRARVQRRAEWSEPALHELLQLLVALCEPLAALHESGIVHRDLKPDNVFLRHGTQPVLVDFGLATHRTPDDVRASFDLPSFAGTYGYMAPEQRSGEIVDARTDLYALGCIVFELLVGAPRSAFDESLPSRHVKGLPPALDALVGALLAPRPRDRLGHVQDVASTLATLAGLAPRPSTPPLWLYRPFLSGRRDLLARLGRQLDTTRDGTGGFVVLEGESGIGKTHVAAELARRASTDFLVISAACTPDGTLPLACFARLFELVADRTLDRPESFVATAVARHLGLLGRMHSTFNRLGAVPAPGPSPTPAEVFAALRDLLSALADERPVLLLVDDLQWADELARGVLTRLGGLRVLVLATFRDDDHTTSLDDLDATRLAVGPLPDPDVRELVADMLGVSEPPPAVSDWVARRAEGNPFFAAEYLRLVVAQLPKLRQQAPLEGTLERLPMPGSLRELVGRRLVDLDPRTLDVARLFAILGGTADDAVLQVLEHDESMQDALFELERRQLVEPSEGGGRKLLHDRLRVVLEEQATPNERRALHRRAADLLVRTAEVPHAAVARHLGHAGDLAAALPHLERAGEVALERGAHEAAVRHYDDVRSTAAALDLTFPAARRARWAMGSAHAHYGRGDMPSTEHHVREALGQVGLHLPRGRAGWTALAVKEGVTASLRLGEAADSALHREVAQAVQLLPYRYFYDEDLLPVIGSALLAANLARRADSVASGPISLLAFLAGLARMPRLSRQYFDTAARGAWAQHDYREAAQVLSLECMDHGNYARWAEAERAALEAADACARTNDPWLHETVETSRAHVEYFTGRFESARRRAQQLAHVATERKHDQHAVWGLYLQARSDLPFGRWVAAKQLLEEALARLAARPEVISEVACHGMLARAAYELGDHAQAEEHALWVVRSVEKRAPPAYPSLVGHAGAAHVLRALPTSASRRRASRSIGASLWRFASMFPVVYPTACLHTGLLLPRRVGAPLLERGARWAQVHGMPWDEARLLEAAGHTARAREIDTGLGIT